MTHSVRKLDSRGYPKGRPGASADEGLVVVGASMRHRDGRFHHARVRALPMGGWLRGRPAAFTFLAYLVAAVCRCMGLVLVVAVCLRAVPSPPTHGAAPSPAQPPFFSRLCAPPTSLFLVHSSVGWCRPALAVFACAGACACARGIFHRVAKVTIGTALRRAGWTPWVFTSSRSRAGKRIVSMAKRCVCPSLIRGEAHGCPGLIPAGIFQ